MISTAAGVEYVTLSHNTPSKTLRKTDLIEIVGFSGVADPSTGILKLRLANGNDIQMQFAGRWSSTAVAAAFGTLNKPVGQKFTGLSSIELKTEDTDFWKSRALTVKITSAQEINAVTPSAVLVLPEDATGNFDVIIESSADLVKWVPFFSQTVSSDERQKFFRTRVTKTPAPEPGKK